MSSLSLRQAKRNFTRTQEQQLPDDLTQKEKVDLMDVFARQIKQRAMELQYGSLEIRFTVSQGVVKQARLVSREEVLTPF